jgi:hypothetical protein
MLKGRKAKQPSNNMLKKIRRAMACRNTEIAQLWYFQHSFTPEHCRTMLVQVLRADMGIEGAGL